MKTFEIFWNDLTNEAKERLKEMYHENIDLSPLAIIEFEKENSSDFISIVWSKGDVIQRAEENDIIISDDNAKEVLRLLESEHDCNIGITWDLIDYYIGKITS
jgi:hypothetical protein